MSDNFQNLKNGGVIGSVVAGVTGLILCVSPTPNFVKTMSSWITIGSLGSLAATQLLLDSAERISIEERKKYELTDKNCKTDLKNIQTTVDKVFKKLKNAESEFSEKTQLIEVLTAKKLELETMVYSLKNTIDNKNTLLSSIKKVSSNAAVEVLNDSFIEFQESVEGLINNTEKAYPSLKNWDVYRNKFSELTSAFTNEITVIMACDDANDVIEMSLALQHRVITQGSFLKGRIYRAVEIHLKQLIKNTISCDEHDNEMTQLIAQFEDYKVKIKDHYEGNYKAVIAEYATLVDDASTTYQQDLKEICQQGLSDADLIEVLKAEIIRLKEELAIATKPLTFPGLSPQAIAGNAIINYYHKIGYYLDALDWESTETGYKLLFHVGRNGSKSVFAEHLNDGENPEKIKEAVTNALNVPKFTHNMRGGHMVLEIQTSYPRKNIIFADIDKIWVPASKFESYVRRWERIRITAGSTGGKSPTAKNLALAIMNSRKGEGEIRLYDPQHGSKKDYWDMPKAGESHEDNVKGMEELNQLLDSRSTSQNASQPFTLFIFDEVDSTITKFKGKVKFVDLVTYSLKQGSHQNLGCIYVGQSADANEIPGMTWSDWASAVQLHIGANAPIYLDKAKALISEDKTRLLEQYRKIQEYCDRKNEELGLDIFSDATAYRFALAVPLTGLPKFIQLPDFDSYDYYQVMNSPTKDEETITPPRFEEITAEVSCPHCDSTNTVKNGKHRDGRQFYSCSDCDGKPTKFLADGFINSNYEKIDY